MPPARERIIRPFVRRALRLITLIIVGAFALQTNYRQVVSDIAGSFKPGKLGVPH